MFTIDEGKTLIGLARSSIKADLSGNEPPDHTKFSAKFHELRGVFVTLNKRMGSQKGLRGCIGYPYPDKPLVEATISSAISAATQDPRFLPVTLKELSEITIEVTILTVPEYIEIDNPDDYLKHIQIGRDGLIAEQGWRKGLLLPQVPIDQGWDVKQYLSHTCQKAGLSSQAWLNRDTRIYRFEGIIFEEETPQGLIHHRTFI